jgi:hypothetical protein
MNVEMETTSQSATRTPTFHSDDVESLGNYRMLSVLALVSLVIGLASPLAFAAPLARAIPLIGIGIALIALRRLAVSGGVLAGRWAAMTGLALSVVSLLAVLSYNQVLEHLQVRQAEEFGKQWLATLQSGDTKRAFRLTSQGTQPPRPPDEPGMAAQKNPYDEFLANPVIERLTQSGASGQIQLESTYSYDLGRGGGCWVGQRFAVSADSAKSNKSQSSQGPIHVDLKLQRGRLPGEGWSRWLVVSYQDADSAAGKTADHAHDGHDHAH